MWILTGSQILYFILVSCLGFIVEAKLKGKFIIMGDIHFDPTYDAAGDSCNVAVPKAERLPYGNYECDTAVKMMKSAFEKVNEEASDTDFVVFAGDIVQHARNKSFLNQEKVVNIIKNATKSMREMIREKVPIIPVLGNHDYWPTSQVPPNTDDAFMGELAKIFGDTFDLSQSERDSFKRGGYYSRLLDGKLLLLVLNTNFYKPSNQASDPGNDPDPAGQFAWMKDQLATARSKGYRVHMMIHIPPGMSESQDIQMFKVGYNQAFNKIILDYSDVISAIQAAHTHTDSFRFYYKDSKPVAPLFLGPAVTPWRRKADGSPPKNPGIRSVKFSTSGDMGPIDYTQFYVELEQANKGGNSKPKWKKEYKFTEAYSEAGGKDTSPESLEALTKSFDKKDSEAFKNYCLWNFVKIADATNLPAKVDLNCDCQVKAVHMCSFSNLDYGEYDKCKEKRIKDDCSEAYQIKMSIWGLLLPLCLFLQHNL